ncbi:MAG: tRNA lysidine(34) synthetase TilS [Eubacterium sp.]|jgi:tRNA(Ile)-lysidine synthase|nr:tRNA lysidine(34) synthetase TilS [Eubacterium sp.]
MLANIERAVSSYSMLEGLERGGAVTVALSGGADSVSLLHALKRLCTGLGLVVKACHLNHKLRGEESERDERFVRHLCEEYNVPLTVKSSDVAALKQKHQSIEEIARNERYSFFDEAVLISGGKIATAHTADDNAETVLFNLVRGSALKGLCGIPPVRGNIIRPLIFCGRAEVEQYCRENNLEYVTDSTNLLDEYTRNRIRNNIIPLLRGINPAVLDAVNRMTDELRRDEEFIAGFAAETLSKANENDKYSAEILNTVPSPVLNRIIAIILSQNNISPSKLLIYGIRDILADGRGKINIKKDVFAIVKKGFFYLERQKQSYRKKD